MSKINCEICGTVYPDNASACPICGTARPTGEAGDAAQQPQQTQEAQAQRVRGGRYSRKNVRKRKREAQKAELASQLQNAPEPEAAPKQEGNNKGLKIVVALLLLAVLLVGAYIGIRFWQGRDAYDKSDGTSQTTETSGTTDTSAPAEVACTDLVIADVDLTAGIQLQEEGSAWPLSITAQPEGTTDQLAIVSSDESVAKIEVSGSQVQIVAVAPGSAQITVTCGSVTKTFPVTCAFETQQTTEPTETTEETTETTTAPTTEPRPSFQLSRSDITFFSEGETYSFGVGSGIAPGLVTWASNDESIVTISDTGRATAVGEGVTTITATYNGETQSCIIRCTFPDETEETEETEETTEPDETTEPTESTGETEETEETEPADEWYINYEDVTIDVGESFTLRIRNTNGNTASVSWSVSTEGIVTIDGNTVTGAASGVTTVSATYEGVTYRCIVRVR